MYYLTFERNSSMTYKRNSLIKTSECACICARSTLKRLSVSCHSWTETIVLAWRVIVLVIAEWSAVLLRWQIRVFTFMVGREVGKVKHIQWMACSYHGRRCFHPRLQQGYLLYFGLNAFIFIYLLFSCYLCLLSSAVLLSCGSCCFWCASALMTRLRFFCDGAKQPLVM